MSPYTGPEDGFNTIGEMTFECPYCGTEKPGANVTANAIHKLNCPERPPEEQTNLGRWSE